MRYFGKRSIVGNLCPQVNYPLSTGGSEKTHHILRSRPVECDSGLFKQVIHDTKRSRIDKNRSNNLGLDRRRQRDKEKKYKKEDFSQG